MSNKSRDNQDWMSVIGESLRNTEIEPDAALWSRVEGSLDARATTPRRYLWSAVAAAAAMIGVALAVWMTEPTTPTVEIIAEAEEMEIVDAEEVTTEKVTTEEVTIEEMPTERIAIEEQRTIIVERKAVEEVYVAQAQTQTQPQNKTPQQNEATTPEKPSTEEASPRSRYERYYQYEAEEIPQKTKRVELALLYAGGVGSSVSSPATISRHMTISSTFSEYGTSEVSFNDIYDSSDISHHQPFSVGLRVQRELTHRLLIGSGLVYSRLSSDVDLTLDNNAKQHIHLIGVPIQLKYRFMTHNRFSLYCGGGATIEYCVDAKVGGQHIDERKWHYSADVNLGAEYRLNSWAGLYFEPSLSHYFTQTHLQSIRNNSPTTFSLHIGVSFTL